MNAINKIMKKQKAEPQPALPFIIISFLRIKDF
jgi:hypothetical protein